jgi:hypothetical protein
MKNRKDIKIEIVSKSNNVKSFYEAMILALGEEEVKNLLIEAIKENNKLIKKQL